ncbi:mucin-2-like isoform X2 [Photinus pyralis]|nr:mucin-2-like isoform X2 [Photinus pyralis]
MSQEFDVEGDGRHTMVIDASDRPRETTTPETEQHEDMDAKSSVLAHEQKISTYEQLPTPQIETPSTVTLEETQSTFLSSAAIEPSESQIPMLSTPSEEDIAKILASLQAAQSSVPTEPLQISTLTTDEQKPTLSSVEELATTGTGGATTIFFDDDFILENTAIFDDATKKPEETAPTPTTTTTETVTEDVEEEVEEEEEPAQSTTLASSTEAKEDSLQQTEETTTDSVEITSPEPHLELNETKTDVTCTAGVQIIPTTAYKTLTYLTTFFIPQDDTSTTTSVRSNKVVSTEIGFETQSCTISASPIMPVTVSQTQELVTTTEEDGTTLRDTTTTEEQTTEPVTDVTRPVETTPLEITTEKRHVTESEPEASEMTTENGEEIEVLFKTLYTTYTYLTTFFQDTTSSIVSRKEVITNVITSTLEPGSEITDPAVAGLLNRGGELYKSKPPSFDDIVDISPTSVGIGRPTVSYPLTDEDIQENVLDQDLVRATPSLGEIMPSGVKTYYTTYTYFTTIFVDGETEISSRTEVYTNYVTQTQQANVVPTMLVTTDGYQDDDLDADESGETNNDDPTTKKYSTMIRGNDRNSTEYETISTMVTDVRSSTSTGERRIIDSVDNRNVLEDQMVAESNNDSDILPSPTLLLQTSYTTFTYFTTMYQGTTSSNVVSRLETITNVITETLTPTHSLSLEDLSLPITYFTTFTYWTTLYKDGVTRVTSREETISNVVSPTVKESMVVPSISVTPIEVTYSTTADVVPTQVTKEKDELTTYYTTYTYYTTSYVDDSTVINSRLDTVTNVVNETQQIEANQIGRSIGTIEQNQIESATKPSVSLLPTGLLSTLASTINNSGIQTILSTDVYGTYIDGVYANVLESTTLTLTDSVSPTSSQTTVLPTGVVSLNQGKIIDAQEISTLYYTTQAIGTYIDNLYAQVIESTSSLNIDEAKKSLLANEEQPKHRTGLVRLIEGSIVQNRTTTLYQSKVIGTVIDGRYAQIIESTSSFIIDKTKEPSISFTPSSGISPTATQMPDEKILPTNTLVTPSHVAIESSLTDVTKADEETTTEGEDLEEGDDEEDQENSQTPENGRKKSRLTFQTRKRTFKPAFRPFSSRVRPTFAPKRNKLGPGGATTITRTDFTPTVTAVPASKTGGRFNARKSFTGATSSLAVQPSASGSRRFVRPKSSALSSTVSSNSFTPRGRSSTIKATPTISGSRKFNSKTSSQLRSSSLYTGSNRFARIRPTSVSPLSRASAKPQTPPSDEVNDADNDLTTQITENPTEFTDETQETTLTVATTTELSRRGQNPLLKFRKPLSRPTSTPKVTPPSKFQSKIATKTTSTTLKPKTTRPIAALQNRQRPGLLPRRGLFATTTTTPAPEEEEEDGEDEEEFEEEEGEEDTDYEGSNRNTQTVSTPPPKLSKPNVSVRPFKFRQRSKRDTNYTRLRRPQFLRSSTAPPKEEEPVTEATPPTKPSRFKPRSRTAVTTSPKSETTKRISPTRASVSQSRSQFTLREKDKSSVNARNSYRRGNTQSLSTRRTTTVSSRAKIPKLRTPSTTEHSTRRKITDTGRGRNSRRGTTTYRSRNSGELNDNYVFSKFNDGTITVTHSIPTEATIPVVNGKITEYRNIITAKYSTETLIPQQYSTAVNSLGKVFTVLRSDSTNVAGNGVTEITRYVLNEIPTTTVVYTPTYIRGYKTSYSHVLPSTAYGVEQVVTTLQPALAAQAPLANILLSQLLLGNPGFQSNPLLGLQNLAQTPTPTTEFKTRSTTYVTTVTNAMSTIIPITFRGKEILTTIVDSSVSVVTATELITDTVVVTPTLTSPANLNSLLLPLLLQQQQQAPTLQQPAGVFGLNPEQVFPGLENKYDFLNFDDKSASESDDSTEHNLTEDVTRPPRRKSSRKKPKKITPAAPPKETSVVTLYVSGKTPGEFSTILSTVTDSDSMQRRKREVLVKPSEINDELKTYSHIDSFVSSASDDEGESYYENQASTFETESLESVLGDVSKYVETQTPELFNVKPTKLNRPKKYSTEENAKISSRNFLV